MKLELKVLTELEAELTTLREETEIDSRRAELNNLLMPVIGIRYSVQEGYDVPEFWETIANIRQRLDFLTKEPDHSGKHENFIPTLIPGLSPKDQEAYNRGERKFIKFSK